MTQKEIPNLIDKINRFDMVNRMEFEEKDPLSKKSSKNI